MTSVPPAAGSAPLKTTRPRVTGIVCVVLAVVLAALAGLWFWVSRIDGVFVGPALFTSVLAGLSALIAVMAFQVARRETGASSLTGPTLMFTILALAVGVGGSAIGVVLSLLSNSPLGIGPSVGVLVVGVVVAVQGVLVHGAARSRA